MSAGMCRLPPTIILLFTVSTVYGPRGAEASGFESAFNSKFLVWNSKDVFWKASGAAIRSRDACIVFKLWPE